MILQMVRAKRKQVLVDINTQKDYLLADGTACIRNHRRVLAHIRRMMAWARQKDIPVISTCEVYLEGNNGDPKYCIDGTPGQEKIRYTLMPNRISLPADGSTDLPRDMLRRYQQVVLHKRCVDPFDEPRIDRLLSEVSASEFILIGACAEGAVKAAALGLLQRDKRVTVVVDAVGYHDNREAKMAFRKMEAKGARLIETRRLAGSSHLRQVGCCRCESCQRLSQKVGVGDTQEN
ncbi:MAG TPA: isochorismatase family protein [Sedimentisphaerales bacterium]|nr:isochorismatase family protein [Sedimentisphaerales bacterium]HRS12351.1 isochorismatase family protein [Sedimentisphaerales bacterium]HRV48891.1 isochorismatase family protein [Sedimentisphaerales bacterium]